MSSSHKVKSTISGISLKKKNHAMKQKHMTHNEKKNQSTETNLKLIWTLELATRILKHLL